MGFVGAGLAAVTGAVWQIYVHFSEQSKPVPLSHSVTIQQNGGVHATGNITAEATGGGHAIISSGSVTINNGVDKKQAPDKTGN